MSFRVKVILAGLFCYLFNIFNLISDEGAFLFFLIIILNFATEDLAKREELFTPFRVNVFPHWQLIFDDFGLEYREKVKKLMEDVNNLPLEKYNVLRSGITLSVLGKKLVYSYNRKYFSSKVHFSEEIPEMNNFKKIKEENEKSRIIKHTPYFFIKEEYDFEKKILVWKMALVLPRDLKNMGEADWLMEKKYTIMAEIPFTEFVGYYDSETPINKKILKKREEVLKDFGWTESKLGENIVGYTETTLQHKYFTLKHDEL